MANEKTNEKTDPPVPRWRRARQPITGRWQVQVRAILRE